MVDDSADVAGIVLIGPPAAGKSTVSKLLGSMGVPVVSFDDVDDTWQRSIQYAHEAAVSSDGPEIVCVEGATTGEQTTWINEYLNGRSLVIRVDTHDRNSRARRYVNREIKQRNAAREAVSSERISMLEDEMVQIESEEIPYPDHHVSIYNDSQRKTSELLRRLEGIVDALVAQSDGDSE